MTHFTSNQLHKYIFDGSGGSSELYVKSIINNFKHFGPGLVSNFHVYGDFLETNVHHHHGLPNFDDFKGLHSMVIVGWKQETIQEKEKIFLLMQNWWKSKQFVEMDSEYYDACSPVCCFITTQQDAIPKQFCFHSGVLHKLSGVDVGEKLDETII